MNPTTQSPSNGFLRTSSVLWFVWGAVHVFAGVATLRLLALDRTAEAIQGIASKVDLGELQMSYHPAVSALLSQHGFNLLWFGLVTLVCAPFVWRARRSAVLLAILVGGLADLGYFLFIDLRDFATPPGPQMTWICAAAILTGGIGLRRGSSAST